jgi:hypothetical protein
VNSPASHASLHHRPCGQPAVGEPERFRPLPPQAGHVIRMNATPSDFPFKSTGFATYPVPPQLGHSSGFTPIPLSTSHCVRDQRRNRTILFFVTNHEHLFRPPDMGTTKHRAANANNPVQERAHGRWNLGIRTYSKTDWFESGSRSQLRQAAGL